MAGGRLDGGLGLDDSGAMPDGETTLTFELTLSDVALGHLRARADRLGLTLNAAAADVIEQQLFDHDDYEWGSDPQNDPRTATVEPFDPNAPTRPAEEVLERFRTELEDRLAARL